MHMKRIAVMCLVVIVVVGISLQVDGRKARAGEESMAEMCVPMGLIVLKPDASIKEKKTAVEFPHSEHFAYDCKVCHHTWTGKADVVNCTTSNCHDMLKSPAKPTRYLTYTKEGIKYFKYAFHQKCIGCHKEIKMKREKMEMAQQVLEAKLPKTGPTGCNECHPKE